MTSTPALVYLNAAAVTPTPVYQNEHVIFAEEKSLLLSKLLKDPPILPMHPTWPPTSPALDTRTSSAVLCSQTTCVAAPLFLGIAVLDTFHYLPAALSLGAKQTATSLVTLPGGNSCNAASIAAHFLPTRPTILTKVGSDAAGKIIRDAMSATLDTSNVITAQPGLQTISSTIIVTSDGDRTIISLPAALRVPPIAPSEINLAALFNPPPSIFCSDGRHMETALLLAKTAVSRNIPTLIECESRASAQADRPDMIALLQYANYIVTTESYLADFYTTPQAIFKEAPLATAVIITKGASGASILYPFDRPLINVPTSSLPSSLIVDSTGAGDAFFGALAARLAAGETALPEAVAFACRVGRECCLWEGGRGGEGDEQGIAEKLQALL